MISDSFLDNHALKFPSSGSTYTLELPQVCSISSRDTFSEPQCTLDPISKRRSWLDSDEDECELSRKKQKEDKDSAESLQIV